MAEVLLVSDGSRKVQKCTAAAFYCTNSGATYAVVSAIHLAGGLHGHTRVFASRPSVDVRAKSFDSFDWRNYIEVGAVDALGKSVKAPVALALHTPIALAKGACCRILCHTSDGGSLAADDAPTLSDDKLTIETAEGGQRLYEAEANDGFIPEDPFTLVRARMAKFESTLVAGVRPVGGVAYSEVDAGAYIEAARTLDSRLFSFADYRRVGKVGVDACNLHLISEWNAEWCVWAAEDAKETAATFVEALAHKPCQPFKPPQMLASVQPVGRRRSSMMGIFRRSSEAAASGRASAAPRRSVWGRDRVSSVGVGGRAKRFSVVPSMPGGGSDADLIDYLYEGNVACRELWLRFLSRTAQGKEGWLALVHAECRKVLSCSAGSRRALLESLISAFGETFAEPDSACSDVLAPGGGGCCGGAGEARPAYNGEVVAVKALLEGALEQMRRGGEAPAAEVAATLGEASALAKRYLESRVGPWKRSAEAWCCERLVQATPAAARLSDFTLLRRVGRGTFGQVFVARKEDTMCLFALKFIPFDVASRPIGDPTEERECLLKCTALRSPFLCTASYAFSAGHWLVIAMPLYAGGSLQTIIAERGEYGLNDEDLLWVAANMTLGIDAIHSLGMLHRDIKPDNVMLDRRGYLALADYGLVAPFGATDMHGSRSYWAPEVIREAPPQGPYTDWWSLGVTLAQCSSGRHPFMRRWVRADKGAPDAPDPPWDESKIDLSVDQWLAPNEADLDLNDLNYNTLHKPIELKREGAHADLIRLLLVRDVAGRIASGDAVRAHPFCTDTIDWALLANAQLPSPVAPDKKLIYAPDASAVRTEPSADDRALPSSLVGNKFDGWGYTCTDPKVRAQRRPAALLGTLPGAAPARAPVARRSRVISSEVAARHRRTPGVRTRASRARGQVDDAAAPQCPRRPARGSQLPPGARARLQHAHSRPSRDARTSAAGARQLLALPLVRRLSLRASERRGRGRHRRGVDGGLARSASRRGLDLASWSRAH